MVDDEKDILFIIARALRKYGIDVDEFTDPLAALDHFKSYAKDYSIAVSDIRMPGMSGIDLLIEIKRIRPEMPVIAMTAYESFDEEIMKGLPNMSKEEIVHKPFTILSVCDAVKKTLKIQA